MSKLYAHKEQLIEKATPGGPDDKCWCHDEKARLRWRVVLPPGYKHGYLLYPKDRTLRNLVPGFVTVLCL